ncbi:MAG: helix-turn-helix domain-containing protein [Dehalococcoidia bacterium]|jgi:transcriptional regulator with XRE-family HTH domain|nr:helix-turn-helix domain-containing protein [Dehalococcoidia bacterium]
MTGQEIRIKRTQAKLSQAKLGELAGAHWVTISRAERGVTRPRKGLMARLEMALSPGGERNGE